MSIFERFSLSHQFMAISLIILLTGMLSIGSWISRQIEKSVLRRTAAITALYVDSFISPKLQALQSQENLSPDEVAELNLLLANTPLGQQIVSFKVWSSDGQILYSPSRDQIGRKYAVENDLVEAFNGNVTTSLSNLDDPENEYERVHWDQLIETYAPVRATGGEEIIAVSEFYQRPDDLFLEVREAQTQSWLVVGFSTLLMYLLLAGIVGRGSQTTLEQQVSLQKRLEEVQELLNQNQELHQRVRRAGARTTSLNERFLRRISADLHDGPIQGLALALMQFEPLEEWHEEIAGQVPEVERQVGYLKTASNGLKSAVEELRKISAGLRLPELEHLSIEQVARKAIQKFKQTTGQSPSFEADELTKTASLESKITLYRVIQESLANGYQHAGQTKLSVRIHQRSSELVVMISDEGKGFNLQEAARDGRLGLVGMRERVELLGGRFSVETSPGRGTNIYVEIPLEPIQEGI